MRGIREILQLPEGQAEGNGLLTDLSGAGQVVGGALYLLPVGLEHVSHVALFDMALQEDSVALPSAAVASGGEVHICTSFRGAAHANGTVQLALLGTLSTDHFGLFGPPRALHVCRLGWCSLEEPVLWIADSGGNLAAVGASSGTLLGTFALPFGNTSSIVAVSGNSSHMIAIAVGADGAFVWSTQFPALRHDLVIAEL
eukprot:3981756-Amphidinium_carterae.1